MNRCRFQVNGLSEEQWDKLAALAASSGLSRYTYIKRLIETVIENQYVVEPRTPRQKFKVGHREFRNYGAVRYWKGQKMNRNFLIKCSQAFLDTIDDERKRDNISSRLQYVYNCIAWAIETNFILGEHDATFE